jgi:hypothetical protein
MNNRQRSALASFHRTRWLLDEHNDLLGSINASEPRKEFDRLIAKLENTAAEQDAIRVRKKGETARKRALRESLLIDHIQPIVSLIAVNMPNMTDISALNMPTSHDNDFTVELRARTAATMASRHREKFELGGLPPDFVEQCVSAADEFRLLRRKCNYTWLESHGLTFSADYDIERAWVVYRAIKALARKALRRHPELLAAFRQAKLHRPRRALPAPPLAPPLALPAGEAASVAVAAGAQPPVPAKEPAEEPAKEPAKEPAARQRISVFARVAAFVKPAG